MSSSVKKSGTHSSNRLSGTTDVTLRSHSATHHGLRLSSQGVSILLTVMLLTNLSNAATLQVQVRDRSGQPLNNVVITVNNEQHAASNDLHKSATDHNFIMDQVNLRFVPQLLVVPVNASVNFPNSDTVSHQVYSFSKAKSFQLPLYKGKSHAPITFDKPGLVVLGCNIHDGMIGYIYVTDARWFGETDNTGMLTLPNVNAGKVSITIWSPLVADDAVTLTRVLQITDSTSQVIFKLNKPLRNSPEPRPRNPDWDY